MNIGRDFLCPGGITLEVGIMRAGEMDWCGLQGWAVHTVREARGPYLLPGKDIGGLIAGVMCLYMNVSTNLPPSWLPLKEMTFSVTQSQLPIYHVEFSVL